MIDAGGLAAHLAGPEPRRSIAIGVVTSLTGGVFVQFEGESDPSTTAMSVLTMVTPRMGSRVLMVDVNGSWVILGAFTDGTTVSGPVGAYEVSATSQSNAAAADVTDVDINGATINITTVRASAVVQVWGVFDIGVTIAGTSGQRALGHLVVDGTTQAESAVMGMNLLGNRATVAMLWQIVLVTPGVHNFKLTGRTNGGTAAYFSPQTRLMMAVYEA